MTEQELRQDLDRVQASIVELIRKLDSANATDHMEFRQALDRLEQKQDETLALLKKMVAGVEQSVQPSELAWEGDGGRERRRSRYPIRPAVGAVG
jgi:paraquat-inducible protein B